MRILIFHTGVLPEEMYKPIFNLAERLNIEVIGFTSLNPSDDFKKLCGYTIYPADAIVMLNFDKILIGETNEETIGEFRKIFTDLNVPAEKTVGLFWLLKQSMIKKYEDFGDSVIQETLAYWKENPLSVFNQHFKDSDHTRDEVHFDEDCGLPYIFFKTVEGKERRLYYPKNANFLEVDGRKYVEDVLTEQVPTSPHLYVKDEHQVEEGDVLIDAGVCEGNFALRYADICSKIFLFEPDEKWFEPLYYSFKDCWSKVEFIPKFVSDRTNMNAVTIDDAVKIPVDSKIFLKVDIEGAEPATLRGAKKILTTNKVKASVCVYHNVDDIVKVKSIFQNCGYKTWTSAGYMVFIYDPKIWETTDFRKGILHARNF